MGEDGPNAVTVCRDIAYQLSLQGRYDEPEEMFRAVMAVRDRADGLGPEHPRTDRTRLWLAEALAASGQGGRAAERLDGIEPRMRERNVDGHAELRDLDRLRGAPAQGA